MKIHYAVEDVPLGTGGAVKNAEPHLDDTTIVFNGDVLTDVDLPAVVEAHRRADAAATLVLTPVPNPSAYGLVECDPDGRVRRFVEKPEPSQITTDTINAGIYVLRTEALGLMPPATPLSIERRFFPELLARGDHVLGVVHRGYWIDIGTPEKYLQVHQDILEGRFRVRLEAPARDGGFVDAGADIAPGAQLRAPFYVGPGCRIAKDARVGPGATLTADVAVYAGAAVSGSVVWEGCVIGAGASVEGALLGPGVRVGRHARVGPGAVLGEGTQLTDYGRTG
jgi:NDP-sugar pyrophosphorylase family protein